MESNSAHKTAYQIKKIKTSEPNSEILCGIGVWVHGITIILEGTPVWDLGYTQHESLRKSDSQVGAVRKAVLENIISLTQNDTLYV